MSSINGRRLNILAWNARGLINKIGELESAIGEYNIDIVLISETFLKPHVRINLPNFSCYREDREIKHGGGVAILIKSSIKHSRVITPILTNLELTAIELIINNTRHIIASAYNPPQKRLLSTDLNKIFNMGSSVVVAGDFNAKHPLWNCVNTDRQGTSLIKHIQLTDTILLHPDTHTHFPTNNSQASTLDLVLVRNSPHVSPPIALQALSSDHLPIFFTIDGKPEEISKFGWNYGSANWREFKSYIQDHTTLSSATLKNKTDIDNSITQLTDAITHSKHLHIPKTHFIEHKLEITDFVAHLIKHKNKLRKSWHTSKDPALKTLINKLTYQIKIRIKQIKNEAWSKKLEKLNSVDGSLWKLAKSIRRTKIAIPPLDDGVNSVTRDCDKAELLSKSFQNHHTLTQHYHHKSTHNKVNQSIKTLTKNTKNATNNTKNIKLVHPCEIQNIIRNLKNKKAPGRDAIDNVIIKQLPFKALVSLSKIFNSCLLTGYFPEYWKTANVIPIPKPDKNHKNPANYRPISLLCTLSKILEKIIYTRLLKILDKKLINEQFGFRHGHSTTQQLTRLTEHVTKNFNMKRSTGMVCLDIEKAFDTVWHDGLIHKLLINKVPNYLILIIRSYLTHRKLVVNVNSEISSPKSISAGVPQGSLLGPLLFAIYINDIPIPKNCHIALYADDTACFTSSIKPEAIRKNLELAVKTLTDHFTKWKIKINQNKTDAIFFSVRKHKPNSDLKIPSGESLKWQTQIKYLGITFDKRMRWAPHIEAAKCKAIRAISSIYPIFNRHSALSLHNKIKIYRALILPLLTYAAPVWNNASNTNQSKLQVVQNKSLKIIYNTPIYTNLKRLHSQYNIPLVVDVTNRLTSRFYDRITNNHTNILVKGLGDYSKMCLPFRYKHKLPKHNFL
jgi:Reverse transcriptase (RNA-dependent DNA polymerase)/Endonuclease-reverse transcriptase